MKFLMNILPKQVNAYILYLFYTCSYPLDGPSRCWKLRLRTNTVDRNRFVQGLLQRRSQTGASWPVTSVCGSAGRWVLPQTRYLSMYICSWSFFTSYIPIRLNFSYLNTCFSIQKLKLWEQYNDSSPGGTERFIGNHEKIENKVLSIFLSIYFNHLDML